MSFLFKSKKSQDRTLSSRDGNSGSQGSIQSSSSRMTREEKNAAQRATPTGSLHSVDESATGSPDQIRRGGSLEQAQPSDLAVSHAIPHIRFCGNGAKHVLTRQSFFAGAASKWITIFKCQCLSIPVVATATNICPKPPDPFSSLWRRRQCNCIQRGRYISHGWPDQ
jgi:hypothetical protein